MKWNNSLLEWDVSGEHYYETGVKQCVLYPMTDSGAYGDGVAWNGVTSIEENPSGADFNPVYADDIKYLNIQGAEEFGATIGAYTYPDEFAPCNGEENSLVAGVTVGQQARKGFGLCYRTTIGNDVDGIEYGYKLHLIYGAKVSPSSMSYSTINDSPEPAEMSWEMNTTPVEVSATKKPTSILKIDSTKVNATKLADLEKVLYGLPAATQGGTPTPARLPLPDEVLEILGYDPEDGE